MTIKQLSIFIENKSGTETLRFEDVLAGKATVEELVAQLKTEQMAALCVGDFGNDLDLAVVGNASAQVPGAAAETLKTLSDAGIAISYIYTFLLNGQGVLVFRTSDMEKTNEVISLNKLKSVVTL